jgi:histidine triad (HIT) family protein
VAQQAERATTGRYPVCMDCIFCKIAQGEIPAAALYQDEQVFAFRDITPQAPTHFLVIPREHLQSLAHTVHDHADLLGHMLAVAADLARAEGLQNGYRTVINAGPDGGQTVDHLHIHVLGGRAMHWPPG